MQLSPLGWKHREFEPFGQGHMARSGRTRLYPSSLAPEPGLQTIALFRSVEELLSVPGASVKKAPSPPLLRGQIFLGHGGQGPQADVP